MRKDRPVLQPAVQPLILLAVQNQIESSKAVGVLGRERSRHLWYKADAPPDRFLFRAVCLPTFRSHVGIFLPGAFSGWYLVSSLVYRFFQLMSTSTLKGFQMFSVSAFTPRSRFFRRFFIRDRLFFLRGPELRRERDGTFHPPVQ